jgi:hypothetical protein
VINGMAVLSPQPSVPELPLGGFMPNAEVIQIRSIEGLGPVKSEIAKTPYATGRGDLFQGSSTGTRNIVLSLGLNPDWESQTMVSLRQLLYRYFMPETWATLRFFADELPVLGIRGIVESFEPNLFSEDPEMQISILCPKPDFIDVATTLLTGTVDGTPIPINYIGTAPAGFQLRIQSAGSYSGGLSVINDTPDDNQRIDLNPVTVDSGLYFELNTVRSLRYVYNVVVGTEDATNILAKMAKDSDWPELRPGTNSLTILASAGGLTWSLGYFNRFGGL